MLRERIAQATASTIPYFFYPLEYAFRSIREAGYKNVEFFGATPHFFVDSFGWSDCEGVRRLAAENGLTLAAFHPETLSGRYVLGAAAPDRRKRSLDCFVNGLRAASELGIPLFPIEVTDGFLDEDRAAWAQRCAEDLAYLASAAASLGIRVVLGCAGRGAVSCVKSLPELRQILDAVGANALGAALSLSTMAENGETVSDWFDALGERIEHVYCTDGRPGGTFVWGEGVLPMARLVAALDERGYTGLLSQYRTDDRYQDEPAKADATDFAMLVGEGEVRA